MEALKRRSARERFIWSARIDWPRAPACRANVAINKTARPQRMAGERDRETEGDYDRERERAVSGDRGRYRIYKPIEEPRRVIVIKRRGQTKRWPLRAPLLPLPPLRSSTLFPHSRVLFYPARIIILNITARFIVRAARTRDELLT